METKNILKFCIENGLLVDNEILNLLSETADENSVKLVLKKIKENTHQKLITKSVFEQNIDKVQEALTSLPEESQRKFEKFRIKFGLRIEITKEILSEKNFQAVENQKSDSGGNIKIFSLNPPIGKKMEVKDFVNYFRSRLSEMKTFLQNHPQLDNLVSIGKISGSRQGISIIGLVYDKKITKNKNILLEIEDLTGRTKVIINSSKKDIYEKAEQISLDSVIGIKGSGSREILFANELILADSTLSERKKSPLEEYALFIGDLHLGSKLFLEKNFLKFIDYLNGKLPGTPEVEKIKYLFIVGDAVAGVGNYPNQERELEIPDLEEQFQKLAEFLGRIRKDINIIISPGNHDGVRLMEPQPVFRDKYAWPLHELKNVFLTTNPAYVNIGSAKNFSGFDALTYHGASFHSYSGEIPYLIKNKATHKPEMIMTYLLQNRHLAPTHSSIQYFPSDKDPHLIRKIPDIFISGHLHKSAVTYYNNILLISVSSWESKTAYMEKMGNNPDFCKVPMLNLKTREIKLLDFE